MELENIVSMLSQLISDEVAEARVEYRQEIKGSYYNENDFEDYEDEIDYDEVKEMIVIDYLVGKYGESVIDNDEIIDGVSILDFMSTSIMPIAKEML